MKVSNKAKQPEQTQFTAVLTMMVTFVIDHDGCKEANMDPEKVKAELFDQFRQLPERISGDGMLTYDLPAEVDSWDAKVMTND